MSRYEITVTYTDGTSDTYRPESIDVIKQIAASATKAKYEFVVKDHEAASSFSSYRVIAAGRTTLSRGYVATADWLNDAFMAR